MGDEPTNTINIDKSGTKKKKEKTGTQSGQTITHAAGSTQKYLNT